MLGLQVNPTSHDLHVGPSCLSEGFGEIRFRNRQRKTYQAAANQYMRHDYFLACAGAVSWRPLVNDIWSVNILRKRILPSSREDVTQWRMGNGNLSEYPQIDGCLLKFDFKGSLTGAAAGKVTQRLPGCTITFEL